MSLGVIFDIIGLLGVSLILAAYFLLQSGRLAMSDLRYPVLNLTGAILLLISLLWSWNTASVMIELCWISISLYGIVRILKKRKSRAKE